LACAKYEVQKTTLNLKIATNTQYYFLSDFYHTIFSVFMLYLQKIKRNPMENLKIYALIGVVITGMIASVVMIVAVLF